jgi:phosphate transport system substrate-binding protein
MHMKCIRGRSVDRGVLAAAALVLAYCSWPTSGAAAESLGRPLPKPEAVRPALDDSLKPYVPCQRSVAGERHGSAPSIMPDLAMRWAAAFRSRQGAARLAIPPPYAGPQGGLSSTLQEFLDGRRDFALMTRELLEIDRAAFRRTHGGKDPIAIPIAMGSFRHFGFVDTMVLVVHQDNPIAGLTFRQIDGIYSSERLRGHVPVRTWGDLGLTQKEWRDRPVVALGSGRRGMEDSAKAVVIRQRILTVANREGSWNDRLPAMGDGGDNVSAWVAKSPGAIGITGLGQMVPGVKAVAIAERDTGPFVAPTQPDVYDGRYPLIRSIDLLVAASPDGSIDPLLAEWARFLLSREGQSIVLEQGVFLPLRGRLLQLAKAQIERVDPSARRCEWPSGRERA